MKQHITEEQWNELSKKGKQKLVVWALDHEYIGWENQCHDDECNCAYITDPLLSIGQMIEFLHRDPYFVELEDIPITETYCDDLWKACKEILEME